MSLSSDTIFVLKNRSAITKKSSKSTFVASKFLLRMCVILLPSSRFWGNTGLRLHQYKNWDPEKAVEDYYARIRGHEKYYEPLEERTWPYIKIINVSTLLLLFSNLSMPLSFLGRREDYLERKPPMI